MIVQITREKGFISHEMSIEGVSKLQYRGELFTDNGVRVATSLHHSLPVIFKNIQKEAIKLDKNERNIEVG